jgi:ligand-binding sensor domain-containing protein
MKRLFLPLIVIIFIAPVLMQCEKRENNDDSIEDSLVYLQKWFTQSDGLAANYVSAIAVDKEGNKWFGTSLGVSKFDGNTWTTYTTSDGLVWHWVSAIAIDKEGNKWFGTGRGVSKFDGNTWTSYTTLDGLVDNQIRAIAIDKEGNKWFGTSLGVSKFDGNTWTTYTTSDGLPDNFVLTIAVDNEGNKWFGTGMGVSKFDGNTWTTYTTSDGLFSNYVRIIAIDKEGNKWFGGGAGVSKFDGTGWTKYSISGFGGNSVSTMVIDEKDNIWIANDNIKYESFPGSDIGMDVSESNGILIFNGKTWGHYGISTINFVNSIVIDKEGNKWLGTNNGVCIISN